MGEPFAFRDFHFCECGVKGGILWAAGVNAELDFVGGAGHVANSHLREVHSVNGILDAEIILAPAKAIPHGFYIGGNRGGCPVGIAHVGDNAS